MGQCVLGETPDGTDAAEPTPPLPSAQPPSTKSPSPPEDPPMEIHKPKPIHTWRELLTEIGVIVIGVAIALAGEQTVEALHWHYRVNDAMEAIRLELRDDT